MFRNRTNSQKPNDELYASFKATFPQLVGTTRAPNAPSHTHTGSHSLTDALDVAILPRHFGETEEIKDTDPTPRGNVEPWRFTPSLLDPNSFAFASFANQMPGYYTPTPGGTNTLYHSQAGDLHTPGFSIGLGTPLSLPTSEGPLNAMQASTAPMQAFHTHALATQHFQNPNPFGLQHAQTFPPHQFQHQPLAFEPPPPPPPAPPHEDSSMDAMPVDVEMQEQTSLTFPTHLYEEPAQQRPPPHQAALEQFRWHVTLNAPTAMIKHADEIPVTYLNKGQAYSIAVVDTVPGQISPTPSKYRTFIRISFEDDQQRQRPAQCWQLWKEGRGTNEAHQRGGRLQAVEFVDPTQVGGGDITGRPRIELESASFDGFCVTWSPAPNQPAECSIAVRFNFLSTDFSHSKGVKGIPVRLCSKTEMLTNGVPGALELAKSEICYCKVKLFRDHGAERKLSNDIAHVKKSIDKLKQQIAQAESGMKDFGKRKRSGSIAKGGASSKPGKVPKHKRTWSMSSHSSTGNRTAEEDLHIKLATLQDMFTSTRPASILYLKGEDMDDPDLHPVHLEGGTSTDLVKTDARDTAMWESQSGTSSIVSPTPSNQSLQSGERRGSSFQHPAPFNPPSRMSSNEWRSLPGQTATGDIQPIAVRISPSDQPVKIKKQGIDPGSVSGWIEALGVDESYQPPSERAVKPIACFYVQPTMEGEPPEDNYYRAIYLMQRTIKDLANAIAGKCNIEPTQVVRTLRINTQGLNILMDDEMVREIPEGQDMTAEFAEVNVPSQTKREWDSGPTDIQVDGDVGTIENVVTHGFELKLYY